MQKLFLALSLLTASFSFSQNSFSGSVLDANTKLPIVGATVLVQETEKGTITDLEGNFSLQNLEAGNYSLVISSLGYGRKIIEINIPSEEKAEILLAPSAIEIKEVIVSTPFHKLQSDNVMKVERATVEELSKSGAINLSEGISQIAGVESLSTGSSIGKPVIRGLSSNRVLVYTQGVRLENQQFGDEHGLGISSSGVESVEVIKGPASLLYGSDALGGVLYLNPEKYAPADSTVIDAGATYYTNTLGTEANAGFKTSGEKLKFLVRGNYAAHSDYETGDGFRVTNTRSKEFDIKSGLGYRKNNYRGDLRYNFNSMKVGIPEELGIQTTSKEMMLPYQDVQNHILSLDNDLYFKNSSLDLKFGYLFNNRKEFEEDHAHEEEGHEEEVVEEHDESAPALEMHLRTFNYDVKYNLPKMGNFETILGVQGLFQTNKNLGEEILIPDASITDAGIFVTTHYHLEKIDLQGGLRYDHRKLSGEATGEEGEAGFISAFERSYNSLNGALGVKYDLLSTLTARLNFASGFRAPNLAELTSEGTHNGANRYERGNLDLTNEQNFQIDLALEYNNEHFEAFLNGFYNNVSNYIYIEPTDEIIDGELVYEYVQNDAKLYGGEVGFHLHPHPIDWLHFMSSYELVIGKQKNGEYLPLIPAQSVLNTLQVESTGNGWTKGGYAAVSLKTVFDQNRTGQFETPTKGYSLLNANLGYSFPLENMLLELNMSGTNLLDKTYISHLSRLKTDGIPNMGRNFIFTLKMSI